MAAAAGRAAPAGQPLAGGTVHLEKPPEVRTGPTDVVLGYRDPKRVQELALRSRGRLRVVDGKSAYFRLRAEEMEPATLYSRLKQLMRPREAAE